LCPDLVRGRERGGARNDIDPHRDEVEAEARHPGGMVGAAGMDRGPLPGFAASGEDAGDGYHQATRLLYQPVQGFTLPPIPVRPTSQQIAAARQLLLDDLFGEFAFVGDAERAHVLVLLLLPFSPDESRPDAPPHEASSPRMMN
jgi:hypothetical protein